MIQLYQKIIDSTAPSIQGYYEVYGKGNAGLPQTGPDGLSGSVFRSEPAQEDLYVL